MIDHRCLRYSNITRINSVMLRAFSTGDWYPAHTAEKFVRLNFTVVHVTMRVGTLSIWRGASHMWYMSKDFLGFMHSVLKGNIVGNLWFGYNCQFYTQITQNWENLVISGLFKWHKFTSYPSHSAIYCVYWSKITNLSWNIIK